MKTLAAIILSAGESRRMGRPKALLRCPGRDTTFLGHLLRVTAHPAIGIRRVVLGAAADEIQRAAALAPEVVVVNQDWQRGQLSSLQAGMRSLPKDATDGILLCPIDHPLISPLLIDRLIKAFRGEKKPIVMPTWQGHRGHPVIFAASLYLELMTASPEVGARAVVWAHQADIFEMPTNEEGVTQNLDDPEVLDKVMKAGK
ncbi:MAG TPA: nucleotidyltransferase family protein [Candidatus Acidoferrales bacterium]|nr:nucleotidyltransferase family protein [Candidatus Acidoferrales bacterium]